MAKKILVIDDEPKIVEICQDYLVKAGFEVAHAYDGPAGLVTARRIQPDLVVLDLMMPDMDGLDVCREHDDRDIPFPPQLPAHIQSVHIGHH